MARLAIYKSLEYAFPESTLRWELDGDGFDHLSLAQAPVPIPGDDELAFRVDVNVLCFSDVKVIRQGGNHTRLKDYDIVRRKVVPGHEMSLTIVAVGRGADDRFRPGQRWTVQPDVSKYHRSVGYNVHGGLAQFGVFGPEVQEFMLPVPPAMGYTAVALTEPWACVEASYRRADVGPRDRVFWLVGGAGPMGQMHLVRALMKKRSGACPELDTLIVSDISGLRLDDLAKRHGPAAQAAGVNLAAVNTVEADLAERMRELAPDGVDYAVGLCPVPAVVEEALRYVNPYGVMNVFAGLKRGTGNVSLGDVHYDSVTLTGNSGSAMQDMELCLGLAERGELDTDAALCAVCGLRQGREALEAVADNLFSNKVAVYPPVPDFPLTAVADLPDVVSFPLDLEVDLRDGRWSREAEAAFLEKTLDL